MNKDTLALLEKEMPLFKSKQMESVLVLLEEGNTIPFIARYRKEMTGSLDEVQIKEIADRYQYLENLSGRKNDVIRLIDKQEKLTPALEAEILSATKLQQVEDLYRPYKQKKRTKATLAKEMGLEPLAQLLLSLPPTMDVTQEASAYLNDDTLTSLEAVLDGAHEIMAETFSDQPKHRAWIREFMVHNSVFQSQLKKDAHDEKQVFEMYYQFAQAVKKIAPHRVLAASRGEKEGILKIDLTVDDDRALDYLRKTIFKKNQPSPAQELVDKALVDSYKRFIKPSIEREIRKELRETAEKQAIYIFGENLRNLLLQSPIRGQVVMGFDPAYRTGCKLAIVDETGKVLTTAVIYPHPPASAAKQAEAPTAFLDLIAKYNVGLVAIGNGTASRESELFVAQCLKKTDKKVLYAIVNEAGASVYSASDLARQEFPDLPVEKRSAISIARRIQDPLAELVKIDPKAVGVGQYQHDVSQKSLESQLDFVVETAVNQVGVNVNTASVPLLKRVAGLSNAVAQNIVTYRETNGLFASREDLRDVAKLGAKAYEQAVGFLRIAGGKSILDNTAIHPESYAIATRMLQQAGIVLKQLESNQAKDELMNKKEQLLGFDFGVGKETLKDILDALLAPGRDIRETAQAPLLRADVLSMDDLKAGTEMEGVVRNVVDFGVFVDIGVKQDGLVHISKLSKNFVKHPTDVVSVGDIVTVWVMAVDLKKDRIQLSMVPLANQP